MHRVSREEGEAVEVTAKALWDETIKLQEALFEYRIARPALTSSDAYGSAVLGVTRHDELLDTVIARFLRLVSAGDSIGQLRAHQVVAQSVALLDEDARERRKATAGENVIGFVPRALHAYLDYSIASFFLRGRNRERITVRLHGAGIIRVGDLVRHSETEIAETLKSEACLRDVRQKLAAVGLGFGMRTSFWRQQRQSA